jgi:hypothetical protein
MEWRFDLPHVRAKHFLGDGETTPQERCSVRVATFESIEKGEEEHVGRHPSVLFAIALAGERKCPLGVQNGLGVLVPTVQATHFGAKR